MGLTTRRSFLKTTLAAGAIASTGIVPLVASRQAHCDRHRRAWALKNEGDAAGLRNWDGQRCSAGRFGAARVHPTDPLCL